MSYAITGLPFVITFPGAYHMEASKSHYPASGNAITIACDNVQIEGNGFGLLNPAGPATHAVGISAVGKTGIDIRNVDIRGFYAGVRLEKCADVRLERVDASGFYIGLWAEGVATLIRDCRVRDIGGSTAPQTTRPIGIKLAGDGSLVDRCIVTRVASVQECMGINVVTGCLVEIRNTLLAQPAIARESYGLWTNAPRVLLRDVVMANWTHSYGRNSGTRVEKINLVLMDCDGVQ